MSVYVDPILPCIPTAGWRWKESCHLIADSINELHEFARRIGMQRAWFQVSNKGMLHYDLTARRRTVAVRLGAIELTRDQFVERVRLGRGL